MKIIDKRKFHKTFWKNCKLVSGPCIIKYSIVALFFLVGSCRKQIDRPSPKLFDCDLQYTTSKWLKNGDSLVGAACPDSVSFTFLQRTAESRYNTQFKIVDRGLNIIDNFWIDEHHKFGGSLSGFFLRIEGYTKDSVLLRVWYNYAY